MRFRKLAGVAAGALSVGVLAGPMMAAPAHAATSTLALTGDYTCGVTAFGFTLEVKYTPGLDLTVVGGAANATSSGFPHMTNAATGLPLELGFAVDSLAANVKVNLDGESVALTGKVQHAAGARELTKGAVSMPALAGTRTATAAPKTGQISSVDLELGLYVPFTRGVENLVMSCVGTSAPVSAVTDDTEPEVPVEDGTIAFSCTGSFGPMAYATKIQPTVKRVGDSVTVSFKPANLPGIVPVDASANITVDSVLTVNGADVTATGTHTTPIKKSEPIALPSIQATTKTAATKIDVAVKSLTIKVTNYGMTFPCTLPAPVSVGSHTVAGVPVVKPPAPAPAKATTTKITSAKAKAKKVTVKGTVKAGKTNASGKAKIVIKKGKKTVFTKTVTLKKGGVFTATTKKLAKGKHKVTVTFAGTKSFKKSSASKNVTVK